MFTRRHPTPQKEPRTGLMRISAMSAEQRRQVAQYRFTSIQEHLIAAGCSVMPSDSALAINFFTGDDVLTVIIDSVDPAKISLNMVFDTPGDLADVRWSCFIASAKSFSAKAIADEVSGVSRVYISVGVYAEDISAFTNSLKAYVSDIINLNREFSRQMTRGDDLDHFHSGTPQTS